MEGTLDKKLREKHACFRKDKYCTDHIATPRTILEHSTEWWQSRLCIDFIHFEKAFDSVDRCYLNTDYSLRNTGKVCNINPADVRKLQLPSYTQWKTVYYF